MSRKSDRARIKAMFGGKCAYCGCVLPESGWHVDHVEPIFRLSGIAECSPAEKSRTGYSHKWTKTGEIFNPEGDHVDNCYPACAPCNLFKSTYSVEGFRRQVSAQVERARKNSVNFRTAERFGLIEETNRKVTFWFEKFQSAGKADTTPQTILNDQTNKV